ncbi:MAG: immunoglobulin-like domain-containing protein [Verrucomicrobiota bacterium]
MNKLVIRAFLLILMLVTPAAQISASGQSVAQPSDSTPWSEIGAKAVAQYNGNGLSISPVARGALLRCVFQKIEGRATQEGLWLTSTAGSSTADRFRVIARAWGRSEANLQPLARTGTVQVEPGLARFIRPGLIEEYSVGVVGVRQDFVVAESPAGAGKLHVDLEVVGARAEAADDGARLVLDGSGRRISYDRLHVVDARGRELEARIKVASANRMAVVVEDAGAVYPLRIDPTFSDANWVSMGDIPGADNSVRAIASDAAGNIYVGGSFTVIGNTIASGVAKWDGNHWSALGSGVSGSVNALAIDSAGNVYAGGIFSTTGGHEVAVNHIAKWNGNHWSALGSGMSDPIRAEVRALAFDSSDNLYVGGDFNTAGEVNANSIAKWDGSNWWAVGAGMDSTVLALAVDNADNVYAGGMFSTAGGFGASGVAKWDGSNWSALGSGVNFLSVRALAVDGVGNVYASGNFAAGTSIIGKIAKWNGSNWSALEPGLNGTISVLVVDSAGDLYVPAFNGIAKWDGVSWSTAISGVSTVNVLAFDGAGNLFAGGGFTTAGGVAALRIAKWDGNNWSALGSGMDNRVSALVVDSMDNLYAGGSFTAVGDIRANFIAKWNGISWSALASGRNNSVTAMAIDSGDNLYAADFTITGVGNLNTVVFKVAKWDGSSWSTLGSGMDGDIKALAVDSAGELYAGGSFNTADGTVASRIARWNGSNWSALGSGMNSSVSALAFDSVGNLYAGGDFTAAGGIGANRIAKWDGNSWSAVGTGMNNPVRALVFDRAGMLYAGGDFTVAGGVGASRVAKWNGSSWSALGSGISNGSVFALTFDNAGNLYVGGAFSLAGGVSTKEIAKWDGSNWSRFGSGMNIGVLALAFDSTGKLYAGGDFTTAGRKVSGFVAYANLSDNTPPTLTLNGPNPLTLECPGQYVGSGAVVSDDTDPNPTLTISGTVDAHTLGNYTITYTATDASGNTLLRQLAQ